MTAATPGTTPKAFTLYAPLRGLAMPLEEVPDPAFAGKLVGDGIAIDPVENTLYAPCDGTVMQVHPAKHAVVMKVADDLELLMHIGVDTVRLKGAGFEALVNTGDTVTRGTPLVRFDMDAVAQKVPSLRTVVLITNVERVGAFVPQSVGLTEVGAPLLSLLPAGVTADAAVTEGGEAASPAVTIPNPSGIHARPAAALVALAKGFTSQIELVCHGRTANAKSVVALMGLDVKFNDSVEVRARGADADAAVAALAEALRQGLGEEGVDVGAAAEPVVLLDEEPSLLLPRSTSDTALAGVSASPGLAIGQLVQLRDEEFHFDVTAANSNDEIVRLDDAVAAARQALFDLQAKMQADGLGRKAEIFAAHRELLEDPALYDDAIAAIERGQSAPAAWQAAVEQQAETLAHMQNELLAGRATDLRDVGKRVLRLMLGLPADPMKALPDQAILVAEDLSPSDTAALDRSKVVGICTLLGGASSHAAILARAMDIPALAGVDRRVLDVADGTTALLDAVTGTLTLNPDADAVTRLEADRAARQAAKQDALAHCHEAAVTRDGHQVEVVCNIGSAKDARKGMDMGAEGVGLLRSEFLYLSRATAPSEEEQAAAYGEILEAMQGKPVIVRTLDVGGDKPLPYLPLPKEENPFLGERGIRVGLNHPAILRQQIRALLQASPKGKLRIMFPMIATLQELRLAKQVVEEERQKLGAAPVEVGIMVEVPSAAVMAEQLAREADFFSIGTNDLTQYALAIDRGHPLLAGLADGLSPAVLRLIDMTVKGAHAHGKWVGVCGGIASEADAVPLLLGLGVDEFSVSVPALPEVKAQIRNLDQRACQALAAQALNCDDANAVRQLVAAAHA